MEEHETCPTCGHRLELRCEYGQCDRVAVWQAWFRGGGMVRRLNVCDTHIEFSIGRQERDNPEGPRSVPTSPDAAARAVAGDSQS